MAATKKSSDVWKHFTLNSRKSSPWHHWLSVLSIKIEYTVSELQTIHWWKWNQ